jgi:hypothetical protein
VVAAPAYAAGNSAWPAIEKDATALLAETTANINGIDITPFLFDDDDITISGRL